ncbi:MAG: glycosyltransferase family 4 protein [Firmicutes bacterium]|nr:glycosyltransferase family 4 protein [Bacillota bacterium]
MLKVIEVSSDTNIGGAGRCLIILLSELNKEEFEPLVLLPKNSLLKPKIEELCVKVCEADIAPDKSLNLSDIFKFIKIFKREKPDIVHTHASMSARIAAKLCGIKTVYTRHSVFPPSQRISKGLGKLINGFINNIFADSIIAVADAAKDNLVKTGVSAKKIKVILNGVYPLKENCDKTALKKRFGVEEGEKVVSIVARLEDIKGHDYFIDAADMLLKKGYSIKFFIAGTGSYEAHLRDKVLSLNREKDIIFTGFLTDVDNLLRITDVQVNASFGTEATSLSLLEGMSIGLPAVVSDFGGNPGVIQNGENGIIVPQKNAQKIADSVEKLLCDSGLYERLSNGSRRIFNDKFTAQKMTEQTEQIYKSLMEDYL